MNGKSRKRWATKFAQGQEDLVAPTPQVYTLKGCSMLVDSLLYRIVPYSIF